MGLEEIIKNIESDTKSKTKHIVDAANTEAKKIKDAAEQEAEEYTREANAKADNEAKQMLMRELSRANTEAKGVYQGAVSTYIEASMGTLHDNVNEYLNSPDYQKLLGKLASQAVQELGSGCTLMLQKNDLQKLKAANLNNVKIIEAKEQFLGGLRGLSQDGTKYVDYSVEKLIDSLKEGIAVKLLGLIK